MLFLSLSSPPAHPPHPESRGEGEGSAVNQGTGFPAMQDLLMQYLYLSWILRAALELPKCRHLSPLHRNCAPLSVAEGPVRYVSECPSKAGRGTPSLELAVALATHRRSHDGCSGGVELWRTFGLEDSRICSMCLDEGRASAVLGPRTQGRRRLTAYACAEPPRPPRPFRPRPVCLDPWGPACSPPGGAADGCNPRPGRGG